VTAAAGDLRYSNGRTGRFSDAQTANAWGKTAAPFSRSVDMTRLTCLFLLALIGVSLSLTGSATAQGLPNGTLEVAYRQRQDGKLSDSLHLVTLGCFNDHCTLRTVTLNQCGEVGSPIFVEDTTTATRLNVVELSRTALTETDKFARIATHRGVILAEEQESVSHLKYQFTYLGRPQPDTARAHRLRNTFFFSSTVGFSGAMVKSSDIVGKILSVELVPIKAPLGFGAISLTCPVLFRTLPQQ